MTPGRAAGTAAVGLGAGLAAGLLGVGGGIVMVPLLVAVVGLKQHQAHATSLAAIVLIAAAGTLRFAIDGSVNLAAAGLLTLGSLGGAALGARTMARMKERFLKISFGIVGLVVAVVLVAGAGTT